MIKLNSRRNKSVGFIDPYVIFKEEITPQPTWRAQVERNLMRFDSSPNERNHSSFYNIGYRTRNLSFPNHDFYRSVYTKGNLNATQNKDRSTVRTFCN